MIDLFDYVPPLMTEPRTRKGIGTSEEAARSMRGCSQPLQMKIIRYLQARGDCGATYDEVVQTLGMEKPTAAGRLNDLAGAGFVEARGTRPTRSGRAAKVYRLTEQGHALAAREAR